MSLTLEVEDVWKSFRPFHKVGIKEFIIKPAMRRQGRFSREWALSGINFNVARGEAFGVMGHNGAGKSTLLGLLLGTMRPDRGRIKVHGRVAGLLDLGAGFHPELSGRDNIYLYGSILGMRLEEIRRSMTSIIDFSELDEAIDEPLRTYSAGMIARLGFATITHADSEVMLVDEVLAVGDAGFQRKCSDFIDRYRRSNRSLVIVSHDAGLVQSMCDEAICLGGGEIVCAGSSASVVAEYQAQVHGKS
jgi:ABC-type polysaccharide/polyol phosphate transport system ATPase subunit